MAEACSVMHIEDAVYKSVFRKLCGHLCNLGRYGIALVKSINDRPRRLEILASVLIELSDALESTRQQLQLEESLR